MVWDNNPWTWFAKCRLHRNAVAILPEGTSGRCFHLLILSKPQTVPQLLTFLPPGLSFPNFQASSCPVMMPLLNLLSWLSLHILHNSEPREHSWLLPRALVRCALHRLLASSLSDRPYTPSAGAIAYFLSSTSPQHIWLCNKISSIYGNICNIRIFLVFPFPLLVINWKFEDWQRCYRWTKPCGRLA